MNKATKRAISVTVTLVALASLLTVERPMTYTYHFPVFVNNGTLRPKKLHSLQLGFTQDNRIPDYQEALGLTGGGDQLLLASENAMQTIQVDELYQYWLDRSLGIEPHVLTYSKAQGRFLYPDEAIAWIEAHPGMRYIIGNEPDSPYQNGGHDMTPSEYADFYHVASSLIRSADPSAFLIMAAWAGGVGEPIYTKHNEHQALYYYYERYGQMDVQALSWHSYQRDDPVSSYPADKMLKFASYVRQWYDLGWTPTTNIILTEFGWYGLDDDNTPENVIAFMDWFVPQLQQHNQVIGYHWWEWGSGAMLMRNGEPTEVGLHYAGLED